MNVFEKLHFGDELVWTVGLTVETKLRFRDGLVWTVGLTVEIKLGFRDGLVWTVGLTEEIKLRFHREVCTGPKPRSFFQNFTFFFFLTLGFVVTVAGEGGTASVVS